MHFDPSPDPQDLSPEQRSWIDRYLAIIPALEAMEDDRRTSFDTLIDQILDERFGSFPVVAHVLETGEPSIEVLPFLVPIVEELLAHLADGLLIETPETWILIDEATRDLELDTDVLGITDTAMGERFEVLMMGSTVYAFPEGIEAIKKALDKSNQEALQREEKTMLTGVAKSVAPEPSPSLLLEPITKADILRAMDMTFEEIYNVKKPTERPNLWGYPVISVPRIIKPSTLD